MPATFSERTAMDWEVYPDGLVEVLRWMKDRYGNPPVYITENGAAFDDRPSSTGQVDDPQRVAYLQEHLSAARQAIAEGVDLRGYYVWSLLDNFEWQFGYARQFGIVYVDRQTQQRIPKTSAQFYADVANSNGELLAELRAVR
jgi:beta-glucosidase